MRQQNINDLLADHRVADVMHRDYTVVSPGTTLEQLVNEHILGTGQRSMIVKENGRVTGLLTVHEIKKIQRSNWPTTTAAQAMIPAAQLKWIRPDAKLVDALKVMDRDGVSQLPVMLDDQIQGILGRDDVISLLHTLSEFSQRQNHLLKRSEA